MGDFRAYHHHIETLGYLRDRLAEDDVYAGATRFPRLYRVFGVTGPRWIIIDYHQAVAEVAASAGVARQVWRQVARYHALCLRLAARVYADRPGFDRAWLHPPR